MPKEYKVFKAAAVQVGPQYRDKPVYFDSAATLENALDYIAEAARNGANLIVFPETYLPGYPYWCLDLRQGPEWAVIWREYLRHSVEVPGEETEVLCEAARKANAYVVMGINERDKKYEGRMYNAILYISPDGEVMGTHRKINITVQELLYHTPGGGSGNLRLYETDLGKMSGMICGEHYQPSLMQNYIIQGAQVNCSLWPGYFDYPGAYSLKTIIPAMTQGFCIAGQIWAVLASCYVPPEGRPRDFYPNNAFDQSFGGSCVINPVGEIVAGPLYDKEAIVYCDIDLGVIPLAKSVVNLTGIYSRWDLLSLTVRQTEYEPLIPMEAAEAKPVVAARELAELSGRLRQLEALLASMEKGRGEEKGPGSSPKRKRE